MWLRLPRPCNAFCKLCLAPLEVTSPPNVDELKARLEHATQTGQTRIYLQQDAEPAIVPEVFKAIRALPFPHVETAVIGQAHQLGLPEGAPPLQELGIRQLYVALYGATPEAHEPRANRPNGWAEAKSLLKIAKRVSKVVGVGVYTELDRKNVGELTELVQFLASLDLHDLVISDTKTEANRAEPGSILDAIEKAWVLANGVTVRMRFLSLERLQHAGTRFLGSGQIPYGTPSPTFDGSLLDSIRARIPLPSPLAGIQVLGRRGYDSEVNQLARAGADLAQLTLDLTARGRPPLDLPACLGGVAPSAPTGAPGKKSESCRECPLDEKCSGAGEILGQSDLKSVLKPLPWWKPLPPKPRVAILSPSGWDPIFYVSTLPGLAEGLRRRGAEVDITSPWLHYWNPDKLPWNEADPEFPPTSRGTINVEEWLKKNNLSAYDLVIAADPIVGRLAFATQKLKPTARLHIVDFHMLRGIDTMVKAWVPEGKRPGEGGWWPSEQIVIESGFPGYVHLYENYGIPLRQVSWRPVSMYPGHFNFGPDVEKCHTIMSGGNHMRDLITLRDATAGLSREVHSVHLYSEEDFPTNINLWHRGRVTLDRFYQAILGARFIVIPMTEDWNRAAGITVMVMAFMAGRPIIASSIAASRDYIHDGVDGLLVPPGDSKALAEAITRLDTDPALLSSLAAGARKAGAVVSTEHWADELMSGGHLGVPVKNGPRWNCW